MPRVIPKYELWLEKFPTIESLAKAKTSEILSLWSGLGYNRRALSLKKTAERIVKDYDGKFPQAEKDLAKLPGIGKYTARAVLCFAFNEQVAVVDTNVRKVILTQFLHRHPERSEGSQIDSSAAPQNDIREKNIQGIAEQLLPKGKAYDWNHAMMDYASEVLKKEILQSRTRQTKFIGSNRYYRGQILKLLIKNKKMTIEDLGLLLKKEYTNSDKDWLQKILKNLEDEGFIIVKNNFITLVS